MRSVTKNIKAFSITLLGILVLHSCDEDFFSTTIEIDEPEFEKVLVVNKFVVQDSFENEFYIGENYGILEVIYSRNSNHVSDANFTVTRKRDGLSLNSEELKFSNGNSSIYNHYLEDIPLDFYQSNEEYVFTAEHPDYPLSETTLRYPRKVEIYDIEYKFEGGVDNDGDPTSSFTFKFDDPAGEENFYDISIYLMRETENSVGYTSRNIFCPDVIAEPSENNGDVIFNDITFDGETKELELRVNRRFLEPNQRYVIKWSTTSKDQYQFNKTILAYEEADDNPFLSPVQVHTNVNNGKGMIGLSYRDWYVVE